MVEKLSTVLTWLILLAGLFRRRTLLWGAGGISFWLILAIGNTIGIYDSRYASPLAGIPLVLAILIGYTLFPWKRLTHFCGKARHRLHRHCRWKLFSP